MTTFSLETSSSWFFFPYSSSVSSKVTSTMCLPSPAGEASAWSQAGEALVRSLAGEASVSSPAGQRSEHCNYPTTIVVIFGCCNIPRVTINLFEVWSVKLRHEVKYHSTVILFRLFILQWREHWRLCPGLNGERNNNLGNRLIREFNFSSEYFYIISFSNDT